MGIKAYDVQFLLEAAGLGVDYRRTLTIGRQDRKVSPVELARLFGRPWPPAGRAPGRYADDVFEELGAETVDAIDASSYEGATIIHDLNEPVDTSLREQYTVVYDGGSLEHVFNFPVAIRNCMEMVAPGGHLILQSPANNQCGHGFYQFSPELFYRVLSADNGYVVERMVAYELFRGRRFLVADPAAIGARVELTNSQPVLLLVQARRTEVVPVLQSPPQQSDYAAAWAGASQSDGGAGQRLARRRLTALAGHMSRRHPSWTRRARSLYVGLGGRTTTAASFRNRRFFQPIDEERR